MPPKRTIGGTGVGRPAQQSYASSIISGVTDPENRTVVTSIAFFAAGVAFLHSSWSELLLPPL